ncbi:MAG: CRISPR-associated endonuclease Cas2 [Candidatus Schekmanbacteria bacterium RBG_13_48_7]|uniref:CRISPR-associated endoribonuclease Cas2 n=1 Tax=Candidatus Schekmanbacteria bacterium RBG_13_48_7 TaxID=1817878 RepID=A0A1F7RMY1_9BACT|nr:MAG: CRISPR-associated endonuclease Cas2 [Candidatus Schekmanbacteria bacterium RBG_13_48_7]
MRNRYIVSYDISDQKRWLKVRKKMIGFGDPIQYSVFWCDLSDKEVLLLLNALTELIDYEEDRVMIVNIGPSDGAIEDKLEFLGRSKPEKSPHVVVV